MDKEAIKKAHVFRMSILLVGKDAERAKKRLIAEYGGLTLREIFGKIKKHLPEPVRVDMPEKLKAEILEGKNTLKSEAELFAEKNLNPAVKNDVRRLPRIMYKKGAYMLKIDGKTYYWVDKDELRTFEEADKENRFLTPAHLSDKVHSEHLYFLAKLKIDREFPVSR
ncbi:MAG: hypothetical protein II811_04885 [Spirochaetaceae bacterium]|nr:hypothetical protein [Spirochaetaceae bacterium]